VPTELHHDERITAVGLFVEAYSGLVNRLSGQLAEHGLSLIEFGVLIRLARSSQQRLRMTELAGQVALTTSGITRVVDRLERTELVRRQACPSDRRGSWTVLTEAGMARISAALPGHLAEIEQHLTGRFPPDELAGFIGQLRDIRDHLNPGARPSGEAAGDWAPAGIDAGPAPEQRATGRIGGRNRHPADSPMDLPGESVSSRR
jgi:MarR family 2-MHQ and catechol resistance regulon transcriptional repressor